MVGLSTKLSKQVGSLHHVSYAELREEFDMEDLDFPVKKPVEVLKQIVKSVQRQIKNVSTTIGKARGTGKTGHIWCPVNPTYDYLIA